MDVQGLFKKAQKLRACERLDESISAYLASRDKAQKEGDAWIAAESLHMIGLLYLQKQDFTLAEQHLKEAQQEFEDLVAACLRDRSKVALEKKELKQAEDLALESIEKLKHSTKKGHLGASLVQLGKVLAAKGGLEQAEMTVKEGLDIIMVSPEKFFESSAYFNLAQIQKELGKTKEAKENAQKSLQILNGISSQDEHVELKKKREQFLEDL